MDDKCRRIVEQCDLFRGIDVESLTTIYKSFKRGDIIVDTIAGKACVGILGSGKADVYTMADELSQPNVSTQEAGSIFGICNVYLPHDMPTKLICKVGCEVVFIPKAEFRRLVETDEIFRVRYLSLCNQKIIYLAQKIELMGISHSSARLAYYLLQHMDEQNNVNLKTSKEQFAKFLSVSRATLFRILAKLEEEKVIRVDGNVITVQSEEKLRRICEQRE